MRKVFSSIGECIHAYAQRNQTEGRSSSVFFYRDRIYSYGHHYLLGEFITNEKGELAIMINDRGYSSSTGKHIAWVFSATSHYKQFRTTHTNGEFVLQKMRNIYEKFLRANKPQKYIDEASSLMYYYQEYIAWINKIPSQDIEIRDCFALMSGDNIEELKLKAKELKKEQDRIKLEKNKQNIQRFMSHEIDRLNTPEDYIRISIDGTEIETSQAVNVPVNEAKILYKMIISGRDIHGFKIGYYTVIGLNGVLKIGCHKINKNNMHEVGQKILSL